MSNATRASRRTVLERTSWVPFACAIGTLLVVSAAALTWIASPYWGRNADQPPTHNVGAVAAAARAVPHVSPHRIVIPTLHASAPIIHVGTTADGELDVPQDPKVVGWWSPGAKPGARKGTAILAGHINYAGVTGALADIGHLSPGDKVKIFGRHAGRPIELTFAVTGVRTYHKTHLPYRKIFDQHRAGRLALVTCGGPFDAATGNYLDNIVAYAVPASASHRSVTP
ncbi:MAG TPA: class F sortase [Jatrophihabitans sp.]|nr:class F sortase [Jatrophihabitans sp.]